MKMKPGQQRRKQIARKKQKRKEQADALRRVERAAWNERQKAKRAARLARKQA